MIDVLDSGLGNCGSVKRMIEHVGGTARIIRRADEVLKSEKIVIPGVGHFDHGMNSLREHGLIEALKQRIVVENRTVLGICLGMQMLCERSEEGKAEGLNFVRGTVQKFRFPEEVKLKIPHMGWNVVNPVKGSRLFSDSEDELRFYFVHSYHVVPSNSGILSSYTDYGMDFCSSFESGNIFGVQFHPEKSHRFGMELMRRFLQV